VHDIAAQSRVGQAVSRAAAADSKWQMRRSRLMLQPPEADALLARKKPDDNPHRCATPRGSRARRIRLLFVPFSATPSLRTKSAWVQPGSGVPPPRNSDETNICAMGG
jgi:hypothetical protein